MAGKVQAVIVMPKISSSSVSRAVEILNSLDEETISPQSVNGIRYLTHFLISLTFVGLKIDLVHINLKFRGMLYLLEEHEENWHWLSGLWSGLF